MWEYDLLVSEYIEELKARKKRQEKDDEERMKKQRASPYKSPKLPKYNKPRKW